MDYGDFAMWKICHSIVKTFFITRLLLNNINYSLVQLILLQPITIFSKIVFYSWMIFFQWLTNLTPIFLKLNLACILLIITNLSQMPAKSRSQNFLTSSFNLASASEKFCNVSSQQTTFCKTTFRTNPWNWATNQLNLIL